MLDIMSSIRYILDTGQLAAENGMDYRRWNTISLVLQTALVAALFWRPLFLGEDFYFRDIAFYYFPNYVFAADALRHGIWPLWNPTSDCGAPFILAYPPELISLFLFGPSFTLRIGIPLHILLAMIGLSRLARSLGVRPLAAMAGGAFYGLSGFVLSCANVLPLFHAVCMAPWIAWAVLGTAARPGLRRAVRLALLLSLLVSTLAVEMIAQILLIAGILLPWRNIRKIHMAWLTGALVASGIFTAPVLAGVFTLVEGTQRSQGFSSAVALADSLHPLALIEVFLPRFFGNVHTFSNVGFWGQPYFSRGFPYMLSLYLGPSLVGLALLAGRLHLRLWSLFVTGLVLSLGSYGPLAPILSHTMRFNRAPVKFFFLATFALCLLAAVSLDSCMRRNRPYRKIVLLPGCLILGFTAIISWRPQEALILLGKLIPGLLNPMAHVVAVTIWPISFTNAGLFCLACGIVLCLRPRLVGLAGLIVVADLLAANAYLNETAAGFYALRPEVSALIEPKRRSSDSRWFAYGVANTPGLSWRNIPNHDFWLYYSDRQTLYPRTHVIDGLDGAFDEDMTGWAPAGATLDADEHSPKRFPECYKRLRLGGVRWILSFHPLPESLTTIRGQALLPWIREPLLLFELRNPFPRAFWVSSGVLVPEPEPGNATILGSTNLSLPSRLYAPDPTSLEYESTEFQRVPWSRIDTHTIRLDLDTPPGYVIVLEGHSRHWRAEREGRPTAVFRLNGRYWAIQTPGGRQSITVHYRPSWLVPALTIATLGLVLSFVATLWPLRHYVRLRTIERIFTNDR